MAPNLYPIYPTLWRAIPGTIPNLFPGLLPENYSRERILFPEHPLSYYVLHATSNITKVIVSMRANVNYAVRLDLKAYSGYN